MLEEPCCPLHLLLPGHCMPPWAICFRAPAHCAPWRSGTWPGLSPGTQVQFRPRDGRQTQSTGMRLVVTFLMASCAAKPCASVMGTRLTETGIGGWLLRGVTPLR